MSEKARTQPAVGGWGFHKNYTADKLQFSVLAIDRIAKEEKELIRARVKTLTTAREAQDIIGQGWTCEILDRRGRVVVLKKQGIEVALFFQRQVIQEQPGPGDPMPERILEDEAHAWQRLDMIGPSAKQSNYFIKREVEQLRERVHLLEQQADNLRALVETQESGIFEKQTAVEGLQEHIAKLNLELRPLDHIIARIPGFKYMAPAQAKVAREKIAKKKAGKKP